jgi:mRNA interferase HicA
LKRRELIRHIEKNGVEFLREGANHTVYVNPKENKVSTVPRHREIDEYLVKRICKDLGIPQP